MDAVIEKLITYGPLGIFTIFAAVFFWSTMQRLVKERDEERAYSRDMEKDLRERIVPLLTDVNKTTANVAEILTEQANIEKYRRGAGGA